MTSIKTFFATALGITGALVLAPFVALFGLMMLGLAFGMSILAVGTIGVMARKAQTEEEEPVDAAPSQAEAQPA